MMGVCNLFLKLIVFIVFQIACAQHQHAHRHSTLQAKETSLNVRILPNIKGSVHSQSRPSKLHAYDVQSRLYNSLSQLDDDDEERSNRHLTSSAIYHHLDQDPINNRGLPFLSDIKDGAKDLSDGFVQPVDLGNLVILSKVDVKETGKTPTEYRQGLLLQKPSKFQNQESISSRSHLSDVYEQPTKLKNLVILSKVNTKSQNAADDDPDNQDRDADDRYGDLANRLYLVKLPKSQNQGQSSESISSRSDVSDVYEQPTKLKNLILISKVNTNSQNTRDDDSNNQDDDDDDRYGDLANRLYLVKLPKSQNQEQSSESISSRSHVSDVYEQPTKLKNLVILSKVNTKSQNAADDDSDNQDRDADDRYGDLANRLYLVKLPKSQNQGQSSESISSRSDVSDVYEQPTKLKNLILISKVNTNSQNTGDDDSSNQDDDVDDRYGDLANRLYLVKLPKSQNQEQSSESISSRVDDDGRYPDLSNLIVPLRKRPKSQNRGQSSESISSRSDVSDVYEQPTKLKNLILISKVNTNSHNTGDDDSDNQDDDDRNGDSANRLLLQKLPKSQNKKQSSESISSRSHISDVYEQPTKLKNLVILSKVNTNSQKTVNDADNSDDDQSNDDDTEDDVDSRNASPVESRKFPFDSDNAADVYEQPVTLGNLLVMSKVNTDSLNSVGGSKEQKKSKRRKHHRRPVPEQEQPEESEESEQPEDSEQSEQLEEPDESDNNQQLARLLPSGSNVDDVYQQPVHLDNAVIMSKVNTESRPASRNQERHRNRKRYQQPYPDNDDGYGRRNPYEDDNSVAKRYYGSNDDNNNYQHPAKSTNVADVYQQPVHLDNAVIMSKVNTESGPASRNHKRNRNRKRYQQSYPNNDDEYGRRNPYEDDNSVAKRYYEPNNDNDYQRPAKADGVALISQVNEGSSRGSEDREGYRQRKHHRPYPYDYEDSRRRNSYDDGMVN